jgi:phosphoribosylformimino-5-aminoimidazole carboxamide ribotide isomerase
MTIFPAIDLKDGKAVRLERGLMERAKVYSENPVELAERFEEAGAEWLHIVDLNGAFAGEPRNLKQIEEIRKRTSLKIQLGGGVRDRQTIERYLNLGIDRLIIGSLAARNPELVMEWAEEYPLLIGIDTKNRKVAVEGWGRESQITGEELAQLFRGSKIEGVVVTDISRDGMLSGLNIEYIQKIGEVVQKPTIASGGVAGIEDIERAFKAGLAGVIVGKALYEGRIQLEELFRRFR